MSKPIHVKLISIVLPVFTFVAAGFTHVVAEMFLIPTGMLNGAKISVGLFIWKDLIPASLGNIVGGVLFSLIIPFYLHLYAVEKDRKLLNLPEYNAFDEQPEINTDSRVVKAFSKVNIINKKSCEGYNCNESKEVHNSNGLKSFNPTGVYPINGLIPLSKEKSIMTGEVEADSDENIDNIILDIKNGAGINELSSTYSGLVSESNNKRNISLNKKESIENQNKNKTENKGSVASSDLKIHDMV